MNHRTIMNFDKVKRDLHLIEQIPFCGTHIYCCSPASNFSGQNIAYGLDNLNDNDQNDNG